MVNYTSDLGSQMGLLETQKVKWDFLVPGRQLCHGIVGCSFNQCFFFPAPPFGVPFAGGVSVFPPVLCHQRELCERQGCALLFNLSCLDQYLQQESDFNKRTLSWLSYLHDR